MDKLYGTFKIRFMVVCMTALVLVMAAIQTTVYFSANDVIEEQLESSAKGIAVSIADSLMWDIDEYKLFLETRDVNSEYYKRMQVYFSDIKANSRIKYIYTVHRINEETVEYILDAEPVGSPENSPPGSTDPSDPQEEFAYSARRAIGFKPAEFSKWGTLLGAYAPIFDVDGEILGLVGVDIDGSHLLNYMKMLHVTLHVIYLIIFCLSWVSLSKYSHAILDPLLKDKLTGAYSKRHFEKLLQEEIARSVKHKMDLALLMLDLDHFKKANDTYGHVFGDKVLSTVSETIRKSLRPGDYFIRYGGEEFAVLVTGANADQAMEIAERIRKSVENTPIFNEEKNLPVKITISIGVSGFKNLAVNAKGFIENADKALYDAKIERNKVSLFTDIGAPTSSPACNK